MIHDVGAGGLSNALPELVKDAGFGGKFELRQVESADRSMSPLQICKSFVASIIFLCAYTTTVHSIQIHNAIHLIFHVHIYWSEEILTTTTIGCNEAQERYVMLVNNEGMSRFVSICSKLLSSPGHVT